MDYLTILTTPTVAARPTTMVASNWYYHGACLKKKRYADLTDNENVRFEEWHPGDTETDGIFLGGDLHCDACNRSMRGPPA